MDDFKKFMLPELKEKKDEIIIFKGVDTFKDEEGRPIPLKFKKLNKREYRKILNEFKSRVPALDENGKYIISSNNRLVYDEVLDSDGLSDTLIARTMVYPNLYDKELLSYYGVYSATELLNIIFRGEDYAYVDRCCAQACGLTQIDEKEVINELKN